MGTLIAAEFGLARTEDKTYHLICKAAMAIYHFIVSDGTNSLIFMFTTDLVSHTLDLIPGPHDHGKCLHHPLPPSPPELPVLYALY